MPSSSFDLSVQRRATVDGEHVRADEPGARPVADIRRRSRSHQAASGARDANQVEERVRNPHSIEPCALLNNLLGPVAFVHERKGLLVTGLDADGETVEPSRRELGELLVGLCRHIGHAGEAPDALALREVGANERRDLPQMQRLQPEGVRSRKKYPTRAGAGQLEQVLFGFPKRIVIPRLRFQKIRLDVLQGRRAKLERQVLVQRAELAPVMRATRRRLDDERVRLVGRPPDRSRVMHGTPFSHAWCDWENRCRH